MLENNQKNPEIPKIPGNTRNTRKYPKVKNIPGNTRSYFSTLLPDPNPTRYPVFCPIPDPTRPDSEKPYPLGTGVDNVGCVLQNVLLAAAFGPTFQYWDDLSLLTFDSNLFHYFLTKLAFAVKLFSFSHHTPLSANSLSSFFKINFPS